VIPSSNGTFTSAPAPLPTAGAAINGANLLGAMAVGAFAWFM
jgi:hypothetical protein